MVCRQSISSHRGTGCRFTVGARRRTLFDRVGGEAGGTRRSCLHAYSVPVATIVSEYSEGTIHFRSELETDGVVLR